MAAAPKIQLDVVTPQKLVYSEEVDKLEAPAIDGLIGIWPRHAPLVTAMKIGVVRVVNGSEEIQIAISEGFMEVQPDRVNLVVRTAELPEQIDVDRAEAAKERAEKKLEKDHENIDFARAEASYERALARLKAAGHHDHGYDRL
ncbi:MULTISPECIES: F0F1 ATP synthase subunit epsilon [Halanaerobium]|jgi:F-type H+-transporting ATPase subunit epsilon|uniref:F0F1 ATP synthase subunit epsilon n=1 Tax=Halanaerobium TaxID=2330 RepID=UPI00079633A9|nr:MULTISPECIES: F0F1 ATP synthase subunit epsilon [Halanaerobium]KXS48110.1 MAG: F-type H+-transporting ATPase subunit epsilon [Halanaerobium sp. T82-1]PUU88582.1 MAG: F-type H+-transporting ATPase subunit epsilon [Halanaerobium sp.]TDP24179.1 ATP synthase F1 subcomplex epsilon subunit [Halanaerobium congolense]SHM79126.1 ATP synthase F1 subcomplex epsilon subunit [Halanaerobium congolense]